MTLPNSRNAAKRLRAALLLLALTAAGCAGALLQRVEAAPQLPPPAVPRAPDAQPAAPQSLSLPDLLDLTAMHNPELTIVRARADAARGKMIQAGLYPNPTVSIRSDEMGNPNGPGGFLALTVLQEFVTAGKLRLAKAAAAHGVAAADWDAVTRWYDVATRVRLAYVDALAAQLEVKANRDLVGIASEGLAVAEKLEKAGAGSQPDVLRARLELEQSQIRLGVAQRRQEATRRLLAVAVGVPELPCSGLAGTLEVPAPVFAWQSLVENVLSRSSEIQAAEALNQQAERLLARARAETTPNFYVQVRPIYSFPDQTPEAMAEVGAVLPLWNRNQGNIASARADLARTRAEIRLVELKLTERLTNAFQRYQAARQQAEGYEQKILRHAQESLRLVRLGYERGEAKYDYTAVLQAQAILFQARLVYVQALAEVWRSVSEIGGLLQLDQLPTGPPHTSNASPAPAGKPLPQPAPQAAQPRRPAGVRQAGSTVPPSPAPGGARLLPPSASAPGEPPAPKLLPPR
jgi:cobalt-zinc-cadmium efflux system outer membrane protein